MPFGLVYGRFGVDMAIGAIWLFLYVGGPLRGD